MSSNTIPVRKIHYYIQQGIENKYKQLYLKQMTANSLLLFVLNERIPKQICRYDNFLFPNETYSTNIKCFLWPLLVCLSKKFNIFCWTQKAVHRLKAIKTKKGVRSGFTSVNMNLWPCRKHTHSKKNEEQTHSNLTTMDTLKRTVINSNLQCRTKYCIYNYAWSTYVF